MKDSLPVFVHVLLLIGCASFQTTPEPYFRVKGGGNYLGSVQVTCKNTPLAWKTGKPQEHHPPDMSYTHHSPKKWQVDRILEGTLSRILDTPSTWHDRWTDRQVTFSHNIQFIRPSDRQTQHRLLHRPLAVHPLIQLADLDNAGN